MTATNHNTSIEFIDILFEHRNKQYGAYVIRKEYEVNKIKSILIVLAIASLLLYLISTIKNTSISIPKGLDEITHVTRVDFKEKIYSSTPKKTIPQSAKVNPQSPIKKSPAPASTSTLPTKLGAEKPTTPDTKPIVNTSTSSTSGSNTATSTTSSGGGSGGGTSTSSSGGGDGGTETGEPTNFPDDMPTFAKGETAFYDYLRKSIDYTTAARRNEITGTVIVQFLVDKDGKIKNVKLVRGLGYGLDEIAINAVKNMPDWIPGSVNGKPVAVLHSIPIRFDLD